MIRLTRPKDNYPCRIAGGCRAELWIAELGGDPNDIVCTNCPFEEIINKLAEYEDKEALMEDDLR